LIYRNGGPSPSDRILARRARPSGGPGRLCLHLEPLSGRRLKKVEIAMTFRSILVHVEAESAAAEKRVALAARLARRFEAALIGASACTLRPLPVGDPYAGAYMDAEITKEEEDQVEADLLAARGLFLRHPACEPVLTEWRSAMDLPADFIAREARAADLVVVGRDLDRQRLGPTQFPDPGDVLMRAGRPALIVPPETEALEAKHIVVGWKDAREARRAVHDALPFLIRAESVLVADIVENDGDDLADKRVADVVAYLARHEVDARGEVRAKRERSVADELILLAEQRDADLIVSGGYGHSRMREWVLGGVTRDLLRHCPKCCLLSH
jgi:nucleotide-binding universal stress UspA family protein